MYHMYTLGASKCMHVVNTGGFRFGGGFGYTYLTLTSNIDCIDIHIMDPTPTVNSLELEGLYAINQSPLPNNYTNFTY